MALTQATLSAAIALGDSSMTVSASTGFAAGRPVRIDGEMFQVSKGYVSGSTVVPFLRGQQGTVATVHPSGAKVLVGAGTDSEWGSIAPGNLVAYPIAGKAVAVLSYTAAGAITLPDPGSDMIAYLNGTSVLAMTIADPGKALDGSKLSIRANGVAAHTLTFASGLSGAGGSYDVVTINATAPTSMDFVAVNGLWQALAQTPLAGNVANVTATIS
jgi:hypothetical protein